MKRTNEEELPSFGLGTSDGEIEINPNLPFVKITPNQGRRVYLTGPAARLVVDFISMILLSDDYSTEKLKEPTDGLWDSCPGGMEKMNKKNAASGATETTGATSNGRVTVEEIRPAV